MKKATNLFTWRLPILLAAGSSLLFAYGFVLAVRGPVGSAVSEGISQAVPRASEVPAEIRTVILGDSLARGAGDETGLGMSGALEAELKRRNLPFRPVTNVAVNGSRTGDVLRQLDSTNVQALLSEASVIVLSVGGNDLFGEAEWRNQAPPDPDAVMGSVLDRVEQVVGRLRKSNKDGRIFLIGLYNPFLATPFGGQISFFVTRWNAKTAERFARDRNLTIVPTADLFTHKPDRLSFDRFHPGGEAYRLIARRIVDSM